MNEREIIIKLLGACKALLILTEGVKYPAQIKEIANQTKAKALQAIKEAEK